MSSSVSTKWKDTPKQGNQRARAILTAWKEQTDLIPATIAEVHERELWKVTHDSFGAFVESCGISRRWAYELTETSKTINEISSCALVHNGSKENKGILQKMTPKQREKLDGLPTEQKAEVFQKSIEAAGGLSPTPKLIEQVRKEVASENGKPKANPKPEKPLIELDATGYPIPPEALEFWHRRQEIQDLMTDVSKAKTLIERAREEGDPLFTRINQSATNNLSMAYQHIVEAKPYAVCLYCQGHHKLNGGCRHCLGMGVVSQFFYEKKSREEDRKIREASLKLKSK